MKYGVRSRDFGAERLAVEISSVHMSQMRVIFEKSEVVRNP